MCILNTLTSVLTILYAVIIEVFFQCSTESVSLREQGKSTSRAEVSNPNSSYLKAVKSAHKGSALVSIPKIVPKINATRLFSRFRSQRLKSLKILLPNANLFPMRTS